MSLRRRRYALSSVSSGGLVVGLRANGLPCPLLLLCDRAEFDELGKPLEVPDRDAFGRVTQHIASTLRNPEMRTPGRIKKTGALEVDLCPCDPVVEDCLPPAWEESGPFLISQSELLCHRFTCVTHRVFVPVRRELKERKHKSLKVGDRHRGSPARLLDQSARVAISIHENPKARRPGSQQRPPITTPRIVT